MSKINDEEPKSLKEKYSIPIYENGIKTDMTIDGIVGDEMYLEIIRMAPEGKLPDMINLRVKH
jgi:hypothetical protein